MILRRLSNTQWYALVVGVVVIAVVVFLIASGGLDSGDDDADSLALADTSADDVGTADVAAEEGSGGDDDASAGAAPTSDGPAPFPVPSALSGLAMDTPFQFGDLRVAVTDLRLSDTVSEGSDEQVAIARFATVRLSVRVTGGEPLSLDGALQLIDAAGRVFTPNRAATAATAVRIDDREDALAIRLQPGITTDLVVVFDVPNDAEDFRLRLRRGFVDVTLEQ